MVNKDLIKFEGIFNIYGQRIVEYTWAVHRDKALQNFLHKIAKKHKVSLHQLRSIFDGRRDNFQICEVN